MPLFGLPMVLENSLDSILSSNTITSWNIKGGPKFTQVTMRFNVAAILPGDIDQQYRRTSPSRQARDRKRANERQSTDTHSNHQCLTSNRDQETNTTPPHSPLHAQIMNNITESCSPSVLIPTLPTSADNTADQPLATAKAPTGDIADDILGNQGVSVQNVSDIDIDIQDTESTDSGESVKSSSDMPKTPNAMIEHLLAKFDNISASHCKRFDQLDKILDKEEEGGTFSCDGCGVMMKDEGYWFRCTDCDNIDFCAECFINGNHDHHKRHIHKFVCPEDWDLCYCDCCGTNFPHEDETYLYQCTMCEDFCMCAVCKYQLMHTKHLKHLILKSLNDYNSEVK